MKFIRFSLSLLAGIFLLTATLHAQGNTQQQTVNPDSISQKELKKFVNVTDSMRAVQMDNQQKVRDIVKEEGMEFSRFQTIMRSRQNPQSDSQVDVSEEEQKQLQNIQPKLMKMNQQTQQQLVQIIQDEGLTTQRFQEILQAARQNMEIQKRIGNIQQQGNGN